MSWRDVTNAYIVIRIHFRVALGKISVAPWPMTVENWNCNISIGLTVHNERKSPSQWHWQNDWQKGTNIQSIAKRSITPDTQQHHVRARLKCYLGYLPSIYYSAVFSFLFSTIWCALFDFLFVTWHLICILIVVAVVVFISSGPFHLRLHVTKATNWRDSNLTIVTTTYRTIDWYERKRYINNLHARHR